MKAFYFAYEKVSQPVRLLNRLPIVRIPWGYNIIIIITKVKDTNERLWFAQQVIENGLSRNALENIVF